MSQLPDAITITGIECEEGLNGVYERNGEFKSGGSRPQWMKPGTRCYIRWIRERWEIYVSHHPAGTTYFFHSGDDDRPPAEGWQPTECALPSESPLLTFVLHDESIGEAEATVTTRREVAGAAGQVADEAAQDLQRPLVLWCNATCPFAQRVMIAVRELGLTDRVCERHVDIFGEREEASFRAAFAKACPDKRRRPAIPVLEHVLDGLNTVTLNESRVIVEYLEDVFASDRDRLLAKDPAVRARVRLFIDIFERALGSCEAALLAATDRESLARAGEVMAGGFTAVDAALLAYKIDADAPFLTGARLSLAEVLCAPALQRLFAHGELFRPSLPGGAPRAQAQKFRHLGSWATAMLAQPSVADTFHKQAVADVKARAVATFKDADEEDIAEAAKRKGAKAMLESMLGAQGPGADAK
eukprot:TRINITY_DN44134_c0_g1_i1.p1 TRINITY_DN44134_c0_g1~~TRINITY_DN44134_c0_g1_i1.p1  ORF type:complete len:415 (-),score=63.49 TRINITY_DN44134_c0_g1_i1:174-1418(-)